MAFLQGRLRPGGKTQVQQLAAQAAALRAESAQAVRQAQQLQVRTWAAMARTQLIVTGEVDGEVLDRLEKAVADARAAGYEVSVELPDGLRTGIAPPRSAR